MFRKLVLRRRRREDEGDDHDGHDDRGMDGNSKPAHLVQLSRPPTRSTTAPSIADRTARDPLGLKVVYRPPQERKADIIFVHGLGGSSRMTWSKNHDLDYFWPLEFLPLEPEIGNARIMTFGYNANFGPGSERNIMSMLDFAKELLYDLKYATDESVPELEDLGLGEKPIIFLVHSMGGLILKEAYMQGKDDPEYASIIEAISSIIFLSTPHRGTNLAETLNRILKVSLVGAPMEFISELAAGSQTLQKLNESFRHVAEKLQIFTFYESRPTTILKSTIKIMVLEKESSVLGYPGEVSRPLDADHHGICKYSSPDDPRYITIRNVLKKLVTKAKPKPKPKPKGSSAAPVLQPSTSNSAKANLDEYFASSESPKRDFNFFRDRWTVGTCEWILGNDAFTSWLNDNRMNSRILWIQGNAASGKSVMLSFIIDKLVRDGLSCHYFFLRFMDQKKRSLGTVLQSLAAQMANSMPKYAYKLIEIASATIDLKAADFRSLWQWFYKETLLALDVKHPIYLVIDGLDEADAPASLIRLLSDLNTAIIPLRVLISSRKTHDISSAFTRLGKQVHMETIWLDGCQQDLLGYISQEMDIADEGTYRDHITAQLLERARGNFLWLHLAVQKINKCYTKLDVERVLDNLPSGMRELYDRMNMSVQTQPTASGRRLGQSILGWATCAQRTLSIEELKDALRGKDSLCEILEIHRTIGDLCGGFVVIDNEGKVAMIHETAREYLTRAQIPEQPCAIDRRLTHDVLFKRCIACLTDPMLRSLISRGQPPALLDYAMSSWFIHLSLGSCTDPKPDILDMVVKFLRSSYVLAWICSAARQNALRFLVIASRCLAEVVLRLRQPQDEDEFLAQRQATDVMEGWATDFTKVVGKFGKNLTQDPDSIYRLIPPFCPGPSMIYQQFGKKEDRVLNVSGSATTKWDDSVARFSLDSGVMASMAANAGSCVVMLTIVGAASTIVTYSDATFDEQRRMTHPERVFMIQINKLGTLLVSYGYRTTRLWKIATGECIKVVNNPPTRPRPQALMFVNDQVLVSSQDRRVCSFSVRDKSSVEWELKSHVVEEQGQVLEGTFVNAPTCSAISHDGRMVAYGYRWHPVTVWEFDPTRFYNQIELGLKEEADMYDVSNLKWHPLRAEVFCLSRVGILFKWDPSYDKTETKTYSGAETFNLSPDGSLLATGDAVGTIKVYASAHLSLLCQLSTQDRILDLSFSSDSRRLYDIRSRYGIVWEPNTLIRLAEKSEYPESNSDVLSKIDSLAKLSLPSEHFLARVSGITSLAGQSVGPLYCYGTEEGVAILGEIGKGNVGELVRSASYFSIVHIAWSEDGRLVALNNLSGRLWFKRVTRSPGENGEAWHILHEHDLFISPSQGHITQLIFHPAGDRLLVTTSTKLHCIDLSTWQMYENAHPADTDSEVRWTCHPTLSDYILGFTRTKVHIIDWARLGEVHLQTYFPSRTVRPPTISSTEPSLRTHSGSLQRNRDRLGRMISGVDSPHILLETLHTTTSGELKREFLIFKVADIDPSLGSGNENIKDRTGELRYMTLPAHVASRIREPLAFLSRQRLVYLDVDRWICSWRLPISGPASYEPSARESHLPAETTALSSIRSHSSAVATEGGVAVRGAGLAADNTSRTERYYFLPGDWVMVNEAHLYTMMPDGTLLCPQNGDISAVQSAKLRR